MIHTLDRVPNSAEVQLKHCMLLTCDWPIVDGMPQWLPAYIYIPAEAKALVCGGGIGSCGQEGKERLASCHKLAMSPT